MFGMAEISAGLVSLTIMMLCMYIILRTFRAMKEEWIFNKIYVQENLIKKAEKKTLNHPAIYKKVFIDKFIRERKKELGIGRKSNKKKEKEMST